MRAWRRSRPDTVGFAPTMGYLHEGHLTLARRAKAENDRAVVSIFVNPTQFGPNEDFARYPRDEDRDLTLLESAKVDAVYMPMPATMYQAGYETHVTVEQVTKPLEGMARPGHFRGVATVVLKLLNAVEPTRAYFGRKDAQQLRVIRAMARDLDLGVEIVACDIVREADGLAMSSRNVYLSERQRAGAPIIRQALLEAAEQWASGTRDADRIRATVNARIGLEPFAAVEYVSLADDESLTELVGMVTKPALLSVVVRFGPTRLLDNVELVP